MRGRLRRGGRRVAVLRRNEKRRNDKEAEMRGYTEEGLGERC